MKRKRSKTLYLLASALGLAILIMIIFMINNPSQNIQKQETPAHHIDKNTFPPYKAHKSVNKNSTSSPVDNKKIQQELENELTQMQTGYTTLAAGVSKEAELIPPATRHTPSVIIKRNIKPLSPMEKQASQSAVFFPGSAPRPMNSRLASRKPLNSNNTKNSPSQNDQENDNNNPSDSATDSATSTGTSTGYANNNGYFPFIPSVTTDMTLQYTPSNTYAFTYNQTATATENPLNQISSSLTLTLSILNPTLSFTTITFCNSQYASCLQPISLSNASFTITTDNVSNVSPSITSTSYISTSITIDSTTTSYLVPYLYFLLGTSDSTTYTQASAPFPTSNCEAGTDSTTAVCTITNSSTATVNISSSGTTTSGATTN